MPNLRHTTEVNNTESVYETIKSDLEGAGLTLIQVLRISNNDLLERFHLESEQLVRVKQNEKDFQLNIRNLYHGTTAPLEQICDEGLDDRLSRRGRFGRGIYFSDNPQKCYKYAESKSGKPYLLRCQVILGDIKEFPPGQQDDKLKREPVKGVTDGKLVYYDSVKGKPADHTEYIIYERRRVLLEYIAFYTRPKLTALPSNDSSVFDNDVTATMASGSTVSSSGSPPRSTSGSPRRPSLGSSDDSRPASPMESQPEVPKVTARKGRGTRMEIDPSNDVPSASSSSLLAAKKDVRPVAAVKATVTAKEQQKLAFQQMMQLQGVIPDSDMNDLITSFRVTYGAGPQDVSQDVSPEVIRIDDDEEEEVEDDAVSQVKMKLIVDFKEFTCCPDDALCCQLLETHNMDLTAAVEAYFAENLSR